MTIQAQAPAPAFTREEVVFVSEVFNVICGTDSILDQFHPAIRHQLFMERDRLDGYLRAVAS